MNLPHFTRYPFSLFCILMVLFLSFFHPPRTDMDGVEGLDKLVHVLMYLGTCSVIWWEYARRHKRPERRALLSWAILAPILMSGVVELAQEYLTEHRGGEWADFGANVVGVALAAVAGYCFKYPWRRQCGKRL